MTDYHSIVYIHYCFLTHPSRNGPCWGLCILTEQCYNKYEWPGILSPWRMYLGARRLGYMAVLFPVFWSLHGVFHTNRIMCEFSILLMVGSIYCLLFVCFVICHQHLLSFHPVTTGVRRCLIAVLICISLLVISMVVYYKHVMAVYTAFLWNVCSGHLSVFGWTTFLAAEYLSPHVFWTPLFSQKEQIAHLSHCVSCLLILCFLCWAYTFQFEIISLVNFFLYFLLLLLFIYFSFFYIRLVSFQCDNKVLWETHASMVSAFKHRAYEPKKRIPLVSFFLILFPVLLEFVIHCLG